MKVTTGIPDANRAEAAALYWDAFGEKLGFVMGPKYRALTFITRVLRSDHGICAFDDNGRLLGVAGFKTAQGAMDGIFVAQEARGKGVGTALLKAVYAEARVRGYQQVRLDVIDTNPRARALYLHEGFEERETRQVGMLRHVFGFNAATTMVRDV